MCLVWILLLISQRDGIITNLKEEFDQTKVKWMEEQEKKRVELEEELNSSFTKEKSDLESSLTSQLSEEHALELNSIKQQWNNKYTELKKKVREEVCV